MESSKAWNELRGDGGLVRSGKSMSMSQQGKAILKTGGRFAFNMGDGQGSMALSKKTLEESW